MLIRIGHTAHGRTADLTFGSPIDSTTIQYQLIVVSNKYDVKHTFRSSHKYK